MPTTVAAAFAALKVDSTRIAFFEQEIDKKLQDVQYVREKNESLDADGLQYTFVFASQLTEYEIEVLRGLYPDWQVSVTWDADRSLSQIVLLAEDMASKPLVEGLTVETVAGAQSPEEVVNFVLDAFTLGLVDPTPAPPPVPPAPLPPPPPPPGQAPLAPLALSSNYFSYEAASVDLDVSYTPIYSRAARFMVTLELLQGNWADLQSLVFAGATVTDPTQPFEVTLAQGASHLNIQVEMTEEWDERLYFRGHFTQHPDDTAPVGEQDYERWIGVSISVPPPPPEPLAFTESEATSVNGTIAKTFQFNRYIPQNAQVTARLEFQHGNLPDSMSNAFINQTNYTQAEILAGAANDLGQYSTNFQISIGIASGFKLEAYLVLENREGQPAILPEEGIRAFLVFNSGNEYPSDSV